MISEPDVNLLDDYHDVHAVAGLLKLYLRELPNNILTSERREDFLKVTGESAFSSVVFSPRDLTIL